MENADSNLLKRLRIRHLELLGHLREVSTVHAAAERMHLSQPAVTRMIKEIEEVFGGPLFDRMARGIAANHIGAELMRRSDVLMAGLGAAQEEAAIMRSGGSGLIRIGTFSGSNMLPSGIVELRRRLPRLAVQIREFQIDLLIAELLRGELDCIVGALAPDEFNNERLDRLQIHLLASDRLSVVATRTHPLARRKKVSWAQLANQDWILPPRGSLLRRAVIAACLTEGVTPPHPSIECLSTLTVLTFLRLDPGSIGPMREHHALEETRLNKEMVILDVRPGATMPPLALITRSDPEAMRHPVKELLEILRGLSSPPKGAID
ncbi:LysR family transcriptional regulator [Achromobacter xylosoxidans]|uniref:LysR family transcriptional regulator n=1 Tax=Alcaligenes xylosoxydans xylosoxydans TaxID=85698 RepID=UPI0011787290|nr:LysR family transcriptional regulator [Achromobacter xylosoxidans]